MTVQVSNLYQWFAPHDIVLLYSSLIWQTTDLCIVYAACIGIIHTEQPMTTAAGSDNKENSGTISANTTPKRPVYHHSSIKGKLQKAAQAPGQSKLAFMVQKWCNGIQSCGTNCNKIVTHYGPDESRGKIACWSYSKKGAPHTYSWDHYHLGAVQTGSATGLPAHQSTEIGQAAWSMWMRHTWARPCNNKFLAISCMLWLVWGAVVLVLAVVLDAVLQYMQPTCIIFGTWQMAHFNWELFYSLWCKTVHCKDNKSAVSWLMVYSLR